MEVYLTEADRKRLQKHHTQGVVWEYDPDKPFKLHSWTSDFIELTYLGIPYRIPPDVDGKPTIKKADN